MSFVLIISKPITLVLVAPSFTSWANQWLWLYRVTQQMKDSKLLNRSYMSGCICVCARACVQWFNICRHLWQQQNSVWLWNPIVIGTAETDSLGAHHGPYLQYLSHHGQSSRYRVLLWMKCALPSAEAALEEEECKNKHVRILISVICSVCAVSEHILLFVLLKLRGLMI